MQNNYKFIQKDCIQWMNDQKESYIDCIITSPPYNLDIKYGKYQDRFFTYKDFHKKFKT